MALMRPVAKCDFNHNVEHGNATTAKVQLTCYKTGIITSDDFCWCVSISDGGYGPNESPGLIAMLIIMLNTETLPLPKCSSPCYKTGIITANDFSWCVSLSRRGLVVY